ncbi:MAG TPA: acyltransferase [Terriglobia bacterium]|nr:acyltransferase [Terriglobia bacterium]
MGDFLYRSLEYTLSRIKGHGYRIDRSVPLCVLGGVACRRLVWLLRGILKCLLLQRKLRFVFMAPGVNLRNAVMIRLGKAVTLERGVIIDGLSLQGIELGDNVMIGAYTTVHASLLSHTGMGLRFGRNSSCGPYSYIGAGGLILIGEDVAMGQHVSFHAENHNFERTDIPIRLQGVNSKGIVVEDDCWVGANTTFLDGAHVGHGCVIGAGSVVRGEIPPYSIAVGAPARVIRSRRPEGIHGTAEDAKLADGPVNEKGRIGANRN